ncbi:HTH-type transcriptional regulator MetR [Buchnera aphidicola (Phyllaphis fagi)]|uniref:HTH-type transcriptional regulator MetR n=1 Tax=Buchnera aphidicola TaxID=9 RepID=UPI003464521D
MIKIKHLKNLKILKNSGSITAAAKKLHQTQSTLSHQFNKLEKKLGFKLFIRKSYPLKFTVQGNMLLNLSNKILPKIYKTIEKCRYINHINIRIAIECHNCIQWLNVALKNFNQLWPNIKINFKSEIIFDPQIALKKEKLDIVLTSDILLNNQLIYLPLFNFEIKLVLSPNHILAKKKKIIPKNLKSEILMIYPVQYERLDIWKLFFKSSGILPIFKKVKNTLMLIQMISSNMGISALPEWVVQKFEQQGLVITKTLGHGIWKKLYAIIRKSTQYRIPIQEFIISIKLYTIHRIQFIRSIKILKIYIKQYNIININLIT